MLCDLIWQQIPRYARNDKLARILFAHCSVILYIRITLYGDIAVANTILLYNPTAPRFDLAQTAKRSLDALEGAVVGFIDNTKPNFSHLVDDLADLLIRNYGVKKVIKRQKRASSVPVPGDVLDHLISNCDLVITGSGD